MINPYDSCVANKVANESQCTKLWHVDNLNIFHKYRAVVDDVIRNFQAEFGKESPLTKTRGKRNNYLRLSGDINERLCC